MIVEENQLISRDIYRQLELVGLLDNDRSIQPFVGLAMLIFIFLAALYYYFYSLDEKKETKQNYLMLFSLIFLLSILLMKTVSLFSIFEYSDIAFIFPAAMGAMLLKILIDEKLAILVTIIMAICGSIMPRGRDRGRPAPRLRAALHARVAGAGGGPDLPLRQRAAGPEPDPRQHLPRHLRVGRRVHPALRPRPRARPHSTARTTASAPCSSSRPRRRSTSISSGASGTSSRAASERPCEVIGPPAAVASRGPLASSARGGARHPPDRVDDAAALHRQRARTTPVARPPASRACSATTGSRRRSTRSSTRSWSRRSPRPAPPPRSHGRSTSTSRSAASSTRASGSRSSSTCQAFERATGRVLAADERAQLLAAQRRATRWTFLGSGMTHPNFLTTLGRIAPEASGAGGSARPDLLLTHDSQPQRRTNP